jgi:hypothetical protein
MKTEKLISLIKENVSDALLSVVDITDYLHSVDEINSFDELQDILFENNAFDIEIIYYSEAIKYLMEHDPSLTESIEIAHEMGYSLEKLNSEILASLLASNKAQDLFYEQQSSIEELFDEDEE